MSDLIHKAELFNELAKVKAPPEANEYKAEGRIRARKNEIAQQIENEKRRKIKPSERVGNKEKK